ncbi:predicted protein [Nematostella vectensis]|uniref:Uncharacterized protein n=1 Tax=Nematostella vectensis TaxID=45351 RepID=A7SQS4_NEMVE|nr:predicted protein [Nematostella vectensis]|eukprot:XP_001626031.1 predicted protein [Nematostella vectensis]
MQNASIRRRFLTITGDGGLENGGFPHHHDSKQRIASRVFLLLRGILSLSNPQSRKQLYPDERRRIHKRQVQSVYSGSTAFRPGFRMQFLQNNNLSPGFSNYIGLQPSVEKAQEEAQTEDFMREKIREYYALRTGEAKKRWMYKPSKGTSKHIREIFLGRCWYFVQQKDSGLVNPESVNCNELWEAFSKAFAYKKPCNVTEEDYRPFFELYKEAPIYNKVMLWSGTKDWAHAYTHLFKRYVTLDDTLAGYTLNHVNWCGSEEWPGIDFKSCPYECSKQMAFWGNAAKNVSTQQVFCHSIISVKFMDTIVIYCSSHNNEKSTIKFIVIKISFL